MNTLRTSSAISSSISVSSKKFTRLVRLDGVAPEECLMHPLRDVAIVLAPVVELGVAATDVVSEARRHRRGIDRAPSPVRWVAWQDDAEQPGPRVQPSVAKRRSDLPVNVLAPPRLGADEDNGHRRVAKVVVPDASANGLVVGVRVYIAV